MKEIKLENGKTVEISDESYEELANSIKENVKIDDESSLVKTYKYVCDLKDEDKIRIIFKKQIRRTRN